MCALVKREVGLPASAGLGGTRVIAKVASGRAKPAGVLLVPPGSERTFLSPLEIRKFPGIGPTAERRLQAAGVRTLGELVGLDEPWRTHFGGLVRMVEREMGGAGARQLGRERPAFAEHDPGGLSQGSISNERTFFSGLDDDARVLQQLLALTERVCWRARKRGVSARTVSLKLRYSDFQTLIRSLTASPSSDDGVMMERARELYARAHTRRLSVRLLGVALSNLVPAAAQLPLALEPRRRVGEALDAIRSRWGYDAVRLGTAVPAPSGATAADREGDGEGEGAAVEASGRTSSSR
jgi:DNA polymerase-4